MTGRHVHPTGWRGDAEKYNEAAIRGWCVIRAEQTQVRNLYAVDTVTKALKARGWEQ